MLAEDNLFAMSSILFLFLLLQAFVVTIVVN